MKCRVESCSCVVYLSDRTEIKQIFQIGGEEKKKAKQAGDYSIRL